MLTTSKEVWIRAALFQDFMPECFFDILGIDAVADVEAGLANGPLNGGGRRGYKNCFFVFIVVRGYYMRRRRRRRW